MNYPSGREHFHRYIYLFGLALLVSCLPLSRYLLSISLFIIALNWLAEGNFRRKITHIGRNPAILLLASVFLVYATGLLYSMDLKTGLEKVKNALPFLVLPVVMGSSKPLSKPALRRLLNLFALAVSAAAMVCITCYMVYGLPAGADFRNISVFMSHIRFAILIDMAIGISVYYLMNGHEQDDSFPVIGSKWFSFFMAAFLVAFLFFLRSATGIVILFVMSAVFAINLAFRSKKNMVRFGVLAFTAALFLAVILIVIYIWNSNFSSESVNPLKLPAKTANGNDYLHDPKAGILENGHHTYLYLCEPEMEREWNRISAIRYDAFDYKHQAVRTTIIRYLTSKDLPKDSAGIHQLTRADISKIENGLANCRFSEKPGIRQRLYETLYEIHIYRKTGFAESHSLGQRLLFYRAALPVIKERLWLGYGTGDAYGAMAQRAKSEKMAIEHAWNGKPHNQFLFYILAFGLTGFLWIVFTWIYAVGTSKAYTRLLFNQFMLITGISMLLMDTLESYDSMVFFVFFFCLFTLNGNRIIFYNEKTKLSRRTQV